MKQSRILPYIQAFAAALLFGASAPLAKLLLGKLDPILLAALLYLGSGSGLFLLKTFMRTNQRLSGAEAKITKTDFPWLTGAIIAGGVAAPITLLFSLRSTPAATASLLLNFETVATTLIAFLVFKESISRRILWAIGLITLASIFLSINLNAAWGFSLGALGIIAACILWGLDNNFTRNISSKDPLMIVTIKGLAAGSFSLVMALSLGNHIPSIRVVLLAMLLGSLSYGVSIVLFILAMRGLGAARTSALFSMSPLAGMLLSFILFRENPNLLFLVALPLMIVGMVLLINEEHKHTHVHKTVVHEHAHVHDDGHHNHIHDDQDIHKHSHLHTHDEIIHDHQHMPDTHHRHDHHSEP